MFKFYSLPAEICSHVTMHDCLSFSYTHCCFHVSCLLKETHVLRIIIIFWITSRIGLNAV